MFVLDLASVPLNLLPLPIGMLFIGFGYGTWVGMPWAWYILTFLGGFFRWY